MKDAGSRSSQGFTLLEMLIVVTLIAILVSVAIPAFAGVRQRAINAVNSSNIRAAKSAALADWMATGGSSGKAYTATFQVSGGRMINVAYDNGAGTPHGGLNDYPDADSMNQSYSTQVYQTIGVRIAHDHIMTNPHIYGENKNENDPKKMGMAVAGEGSDKWVQETKDWYP